MNTNKHLLQKINEKLKYFLIFFRRIMNLILILIKMLEMITFGVGRSIRNLLEGIQERAQNNYCRPDDKIIKIY